MWKGVIMSENYNDEIIDNNEEQRKRKIILRNSVFFAADLKARQAR